MSDFVETAIDILNSVLPDSDVGKVIALLLVLFFLLMLTGRFAPRMVGKWYEVYLPLAAV